MEKDQKTEESKINQVSQHFKSVLSEISQNLSTLFDLDYIGIGLSDKRNRKIEEFIFQGNWSGGEAGQKKSKEDICNGVLSSGEIFTNQEESIFCIPIKIRRNKEDQDKTLGVILLHTSSPGKLSGEDRSFIEMLADILAFGVWNIRCEMNESSDRNLGYFGFSSMSVNLRESIYEGLGKIIEYFKAQHATVYRYERETQRFFYPIATKEVSKQFWSYVPRRDGVATHVVQTPEPIFLNDVKVDSLFSQSAFTKNEKVKSAAASSLGGEGVLFLSYSESHQFTDSEKQKFKLIAKVLEAVFYSLNTVEKLKWEGDISSTPYWPKIIKSFFRDKLTKIARIDVITFYVLDTNTRQFYLMVDEGTRMLSPAGGPIPEKIVKKLREKKEAIFYDDIKKSELEESTFARREEIKSVAIIPVWYRSLELVGVLFINYRYPNPFEPPTRELFNHMSNFLSIILGAVLRETELSRNVQILKELQTQKSVEKAEEIDSVLQKIAEGISFFTKADLVMILRRHQKAQEFFEGGFCGIDKTYIDEKIPLKIGQRVLITKEEMNIPDMERHYQDNILFKNVGIRTLRCLPLIHSEKVVGLLYVGFKSKRHVLAKNEWEWVEVLEGEASQRIGNYLSDLEINRKQKQLESLMDISEIILSSTLNINETLEKLTEIIFDKLGYKRGIVSLKEEMNGKNYFKRVAFVGVDANTRNKLSKKSSWNSEEQLKKWFRKRFQISNSYYINHKYKEEVEKSLTSVAWGEPDETRKYWEWHPDDMLLIPLRKEEEIIGLLSVDTPVDKAIPTEESVKTLEAFAEHLVLAIDNARKYERLSKELKGIKRIEKAIINKIGRFDEEEFGLQFVLDKIIENAREIIDHVEYANIYLREETNLVKKAKYTENVSRYLGGDQIPITQKNSFVAKVAREKKSVIANDLNNKECRKLYYQTYLGMKSELAVPIMKGNKVIGVINVESPKLGAFKEQDKSLLEALADQYVIALQKSIPFARKEQRLKEYNILNSIEQKTGSSVDLKEIAEHILEVVVESAKSEIGNITLWNEDTRELELLALYDKKIIEKEERYKRGITILAVEKKKELYIPNLDVKCPCCPKGTWKENHYYHVWGKSISELAVPIIYNDKVLGVLNLESQEVDAFEDHIPLIKFVARQLGRAIEQVKEHEEKIKEEQGRAWAFLGQTLVHEYRKKLATIRGNEAILKDKIDNEDQKNLLENNEKIIVDMLYELTRLPEETEMEKFEVHIVLDEVINDYQNYKDYHDSIKISQRFGDDSIVEANKKCLNIIIANLFENAFAAMPQGGELSVITKKLKNRTEILIKDSGVGISDDVKENLFKSIVKSNRGMGIFLVISKSLMNSFKGDIELVESKKDKGTTIRLWLPNVG